MDVDIDTIGGGGCGSHSEDESDFDEEVSSSSATAPAVHSPRHDDDSVDLSTNSSLESYSFAPSPKRRAVGSGPEPSTNWRSPNDLMADNEAECEIASMVCFFTVRSSCNPERVPNVPLLFSASLIAVTCSRHQGLLIVIGYSI
jgi:hypothetical protein